jgi:hypothetical protein
MEIEVTVWFQGEINLVVDECGRIVSFWLITGVQSQSDTSMCRLDEHTRRGYYSIGTSVPGCWMTEMCTRTTDGGAKKIHPGDSDVLGKRVVVPLDEADELAKVVDECTFGLALLYF